MKQKKIITVIFFITLFLSCNKEQENEYQINGYLTANQNQIANAEVNVQKLSGELFTSEYETIHKTVSDNNGYFNMLFTSKTDNLRLLIMPSDKFNINGVSYLKYDEKKITINKKIIDLGKIELNSNGLFTINFKETDNFTTGDTLILSINSYGYSTSNTISNNPNSVNYLVIGNKYVYFNWTIEYEKDNYIINGNDSLFCIPFKNNTFEIVM